MTKKAFLDQLEQQNFTEALNEFKQLDTVEQADLLKQLHYQAREAKQPVALTVLHRQLHPGKTFDDFQQAWFPPKEYTKPFKVGDKTYHQFFEAPTRVINATNLQDPSDIISVGMVWCGEQEFMQALSEIEKSSSNKARADEIEKVAEKQSVAVYMVKADTNLGN